MNTYYFTFGSNHEDRNGRSLGDSFLPIYADGEGEARDKLFDLRGDKWSFCYDSKEAAGVFRHNLREVTEFEVDTREQRKAAAVDAVLKARRDNLLNSLQNLDSLRALMLKLPAGIIPKCREFMGQLDIDNLTREEVVEVLGVMGAGKWTKSVNHQTEGTIDYIGQVEGKTVRLWAAGPPESCRVVEEEEVIPEQRVIRKRLICTPAAA